MIFKLVFEMALKKKQKVEEKKQKKRQNPSLSPQPNPFPLGPVGPAARGPAPLPTPQTSSTRLGSLSTPRPS